VKVIFGTTSDRKIKDLINIINLLELNIEVLNMNDIGWNLGEIEENGTTLEENSLIKAETIYKFCKDNNINYPIITDDSGLFVDALDGEPGIYTARYADCELEKNPLLPKYQCVFKLLDKLKNKNNRCAKFKCAVTCMYPDGTFFQELGETEGKIANEVVGALTKPYFYSVFLLKENGKSFDSLNDSELLETYRFKTLSMVIKKIK